MQQVFFVGRRGGKFVCIGIILVYYLHMSKNELTCVFERDYIKAHPCDAGELVLIGIDEAGRGPLVGPVVAAATCFKVPMSEIRNGTEKILAGVRDSKLLSEKRREEAFKVIQDYFHTGVGIVQAETIDRINILEATFLAMREAVGQLRRRMRDTGVWDETRVVLLVDGNQLVPNVSLQQEVVVGGDRIVKSIAAASIVAKVTRDRLLREYEERWPQYGFAKHKGYGTREHMEALEKYGPLPVHRQSFRPVRQAAIRFRELGVLPSENLSKGERIL